MRIAIGQLWQKSNTFNRNPTRWYDFRHWGISQGEELLSKYRETGELAGFISGCQSWSQPPELIGLTRLFAWPWGEIDAETWVTILQEFRESLKKSLPLDGVLLSLHGATATEGEDDACGTFLKMIRGVIGEKVPLVVTLDLQANVTPLMLESADALIPSHTFPRLDQFDTGKKASLVLQRMIEESVSVNKWMRKIPMFTPIETHTTFNAPASDFYRTISEWEQEPDVLAAGLCMCHPWLDVPGLGWAVTLHTTSADEKWKSKIDDLVERCWELRHDLSDVERMNPGEAVRTAVQAERGPVIIGDGGDATNCGASGDSTILLRELLKHPQIPGGALLFLIDPESVAAAMIAREGGKFDSFVGAAYAPEYSDPVRLRGTVEKILNLTFQLEGHLGHHMPINMGKAAVVRSGDVTVLLVERSGPGSSPQVYEAAGLDPRKFKIVLAKSPAGFKADYESFAAKILLTSGPGCATASWTRLKFQRASTPTWPLREMQEISDAEWCEDAIVAPPLAK